MSGAKADGRGSRGSRLLPCSVRCDARTQCDVPSDGRDHTKSEQSRHHPNYRTQHAGSHAGSHRSHNLERALLLGLIGAFLGDGVAFVDLIFGGGLHRRNRGFLAGVRGVWLPVPGVTLTAMASEVDEPDVEVGLEVDEPDVEVDEPDVEVDESDVEVDEPDVEDDESEVDEPDSPESACAKPAPKPSAAMPKPATTAPEAARFLMLMLAFMWREFLFSEVLVTGGEKDRARTSTKTQRRSQSRCLTSTSDPYRNPLTMIRGGRRRRWSIFLNPALDGQQSAVDGGDQCGVVGFGLIGVAPRELAQCLVDPVGAAHVTRRSSRRRWSWRAPWPAADPRLRRSRSARPHRLRPTECGPSCSGTAARSTAGRPSWSSPAADR